MQAGIALVDDRLDGGREVAHESAQSRDLKDDHVVDLAIANALHELLVAVALGVPAGAGVLVDLDRASLDGELVDGVAPGVLALPIEALVVGAHASVECGVSGHISLRSESPIALRKARGFRTVCTEAHPSVQGLLASTLIGISGSLRPF